jgi:hypothetical protein
MEEKITVPYIVYESSMARAERQHKRLWIALIVAVAMIVATNIAWLYVWNSYEYVGDSQDVTIDSDGGNANYIGNDGDINNGKDNSENEN